MAKKKTSDAGKILDDLIRDDLPLQEEVDEATCNAKIAQMIYQARTKKGLTQEQLAKIVGTKQPVIARLEDAECGHSIPLLIRIGKALGKDLVIAYTEHEANA